MLDGLGVILLCTNYLHVLLYGIEDGAGWSGCYSCGAQITCRYCGMVYRMVPDGPGVTPVVHKLSAGIVLWERGLCQIVWV